MQEIFQVGPLLGDAAAAGTRDLSDLFVQNTIPATVPEVCSLILAVLASTAFVAICRLRRDPSRNAGR